MQLTEDALTRIMIVLDNDAITAQIMREAAYEQILTREGYQDPNNALDAFEERNGRFRDEAVPGVGDAVADALIDSMTDIRETLDSDHARALWDVLAVMLDLTTRENQELIGRHAIARIDIDDLRDWAIERDMIEPTTDDED